MLRTMGLNWYRRTVDGGEVDLGSHRCPTRQLCFLPPPQRLLVLTQSRFVQCDFRMHVNEAVICLRCLTRTSDTPCELTC